MGPAANPTARSPTDPPTRRRSRVESRRLLRDSRIRARLVLARPAPASMLPSLLPSAVHCCPTPLGVAAAAREPVSLLLPTSAKLTGSRWPLLLALERHRSESLPRATACHRERCCRTSPQRKRSSLLLPLQRRRTMPTRMACLWTPTLCCAILLEERDAPIEIDLGPTWRMRWIPQVWIARSHEHSWRMYCAVPVASLLRRSSDMTSISARTSEARTSAGRSPGSQ